MSIAALAAVPALARAAAPLQYLSASGPHANDTVGLTWALAIVSVVVVLLVGAVVLAGVLMRRSRAPAGLPPVERGGNGMRWIYIGVALTSIVLAATLVWTLRTLAAINGPAQPPQLTIEVTGEQWWWRVSYDDPDPTRVFATANEIHIPVGRPVRVKLKGADVIHSFWVPQLAGKTDAIPGQTNITWLQADRPGVYRGQCAEYCGAQHAHMAFEVVAQPPAEFEAWRRAQLLPAAAALTPEARQGQDLVVFHCGACHAIRGTGAGGTAGPDLTHLMSRRTLAAGTLPNTPAGLSGWIGNPQAIKPGTTMPTLYLSGPELAGVRSYLVTLK